MNKLTILRLQAKLVHTSLNIRFSGILKEEKVKWVSTNRMHGCCLSMSAEKRTLRRYLTAYRVLSSGSESIERLQPQFSCGTDFEAGKRDTGCLFGDGCQPFRIFPSGDRRYRYSFVCLGRIPTASQCWCALPVSAYPAQKGGWNTQLTNKSQVFHETPNKRKETNT